MINSTLLTCSSLSISCNSARDLPCSRLVLGHLPVSVFFCLVFLSRPALSALFYARHLAHLATAGVEVRCGAAPVHPISFTLRISVRGGIVSGNGRVEKKRDSDFMRCRYEKHCGRYHVIV